ncbi:t-SNARE [Mycena sanguinolenta]|nr:t-SNARE [Mycena sanguinolenta]
MSFQELATPYPPNSSRESSISLQIFKINTNMRSLAAQVTQGIALKKLASDLDTSVRNFQAAQKFSAARQRAHVVPVVAPARVPTSEALVDVSESSQTQTQMQTQVVYATEDAFREAEIRERHAAIQELEAGMQDVAEIMRTLGSIVERQGEDIETVQWNPEQTARDLEAGAQQLETAARHQRRARRTCLTIILGVVCAVVILAVLL